MSSKLFGKKVLLIGASGRVGSALNKELFGKCNLITTSRCGGFSVQLNLEDSDQVKSVVLKIKPDIVINCAAYTDVESAENDLLVSQVVNGHAPGILAEACKLSGSLLIHFSTDYVFGAVDKAEAYVEEDSPGPLNAYGRSKLLGEKVIQDSGCKYLIFRVCWVYDAHSKNFFSSIIQQVKAGNQLEVVDDQYGTPTSAEFISKAVVSVLNDSRFENVSFGLLNNIYHLCPNGYCSRYEFANYLVDLINAEGDLLLCKVKPVATADYPSLARRPGWSVLSNLKFNSLQVFPESDWKVWVCRCLSEFR